MGVLRSWQIAIAGAALWLISSAHVLKADPIVFSDPLELFPTGTISYGGSSDPLIGDNLQIRTVTGPDGVSHKVHLVGNLGTGILNFETGDFEGMVGSALIFGPTGPDNFIQIFGTVPDASVLGPPTPLLLSGTLLGAIVDPQLGSIKLGVEVGAGFDQQNPDLLAYFGLSADTRFFFTELLFTPVIDLQSDGSFSAKVVSTTVNNHVIPEPSTAAFGLTSLVLVVALRKIPWARHRG